MHLTQDAPAKINIGLHVLRQRPDGYHDIETVLHRIDWADTIAATPADALSLTCSDPSLPTDTDNLCLQAARRLASACDVAAGANLHLEKRVPYGAGLGSGSSDAAATLRLLTRLWDVDPSPDALRQIGRTIGADVPFFLQDAPAAYATGRGDTLSPLSKDGASYRLPFSLLIAVPSVAVATPWAYDQVTAAEDGRPDLRHLVLSNDLSRWDEALTNDFSAPVTRAVRAVDAVQTTLQATDAACVSLSGSGSAVYGLFEEAGAARTAREALQSLDPLDLQTHLMPAPNES